VQTADETRAGGSGFENVPAASPASASVPPSPQPSPPLAGERGRSGLVASFPLLRVEKARSSNFASFSVCALRRRAQSGCCSPFLAGECTKPAPKGCCSLLPRLRGRRCRRRMRGLVLFTQTANENTSRQLRLRKPSGSLTWVGSAPHPSPLPRLRRRGGEALRRPLPQSSSSRTAERSVSPVAAPKSPRSSASAEPHRRGFPRSGAAAARCWSCGC